MPSSSDEEPYNFDLKHHSSDDESDNDVRSVDTVEHHKSRHGYRKDDFVVDEEDDDEEEDDDTEDDHSAHSLSLRARSARSKTATDSGVILDISDDEKPFVAAKKTTKNRAAQPTRSSTRPVPRVNYKVLNSHTNLSDDDLPPSPPPHVAGRRAKAARTQNSEDQEMAGPSTPINKNLPPAYESVKHTHRLSKRARSRSVHEDSPPLSSPFRVKEEPGTGRPKKKAKKTLPDEAYDSPTPTTSHPPITSRLYRRKDRVGPPRGKRPSAKLEFDEKATRIDHDQKALERGIKRSLKDTGSSARDASTSKDKGQDKRTGKDKGKGKEKSNGKTSKKGSYDRRGFPSELDSDDDPIDPDLLAVMNTGDAPAAPSKDRIHTKRCDPKTQQIVTVVDETEMQLLKTQRTPAPVAAVEIQRWDQRAAPLPMLNLRDIVATKDTNVQLALKIIYFDSYKHFTSGVNVDPSRLSSVSGGKANSPEYTPNRRMQIDTNLLGGSRSWQDAIFLSVGKVGLSFIFDDSPYQGGKSSQRPLFSYTHGVRVALMGMDWAFLSGRFAACHNQEDMKGLYCNFVGGNMVDFLTNSKTDRDVPNLPSASGSYMPALAASSTTAGDKTKNDGFKLPYSHRVPVYDWSKLKKKHFPSPALDTLASPTYDEEIPVGTVCAVAYTVGLGVKAPEKFPGYKPANMNVQWVAML